MKKFINFLILIIAFSGFSQTEENPFVNASLFNTSERIKNGSSVTPAFLFAVFLWSAVNKRLSQISKKNKSRIELMLQASEDVIKKQTQQVMMPRWLSSRVKDIWLMQYQLENYSPKKKNQKHLLETLVLEWLMIFLC